MVTIANLDAARRRIAGVLFVAQSLYSATFIAAFTLSSIIATRLAGTDAVAGLPNTIGLVGRILFVYPVGYLMDRIGRRLALTAGYGVTVLGGLVSMWAVFHGSLGAFLLGALLMGMSRTASDLSRYVAAEVFPAQQSARVIGLIVFAGTAGSVVGPQLVHQSGLLMERFGRPIMAGPFAAAVALMAPAALAVFIFLRPDPRQIVRQMAAEASAQDQTPLQAQTAVAPARTLRQILVAPEAQIALLAMVLSYFVMSFLMVITPLHMDQHNHDTQAIANVIMWHTLGMFGLSWLTGALVERFGRLPMILGGSVILLASCVIAPLSLRVPILGLALFLLGLGWNFCFVAGTTLFSDQLSAGERGRAQGAGETVVAIGTGLSSLTVGLAFDQGDYLLVSAIGFVATAALIAGTLWLNRRSAAPNTAEAAPPM